MVTEDAARHEPTFLVTFAKAATQTKIVATLMEKEVVTQEPISPELITEATIQVNTVAILRKDEAVTLQEDKSETSCVKEGMQIPQEIVSVSDDE